jgi:hypothetical protein
VAVLQLEPQALGHLPGADWLSSYGRYNGTRDLTSQ